MNTPWNSLLLAVGAMGVFLLAGMFLNRVVNPWRSKRLLERIVRDVQAGKRVEKPPPKFVINFDGLALAVTSTKATSEVLKLSWSEIHKVEAFKRDLFGVDLICIFFSRADGTGLEIDEDMGGWAAFVENLPTYLPACQPYDKWFAAVAFPAFKTNMTEISVRKSDRCEMNPV